MKNMFLVVAVIIAVISPEIASGRTVKGVNFSETASIAGTSCKLMGVGIRKKLIINVYLGALYLAKPSNNAALVAGSDQAKRIVMHFLYKEVNADQLVEAWNEGFEKNSPGKVAILKSKIDRFNSFFTQSMKKGESMIITYIPGKGSEVVIKGKTAGVIEGKDFMEALFSIWFGPSPPSKGLREGMLGD
ncbi:chalcone isomerase family protein [Candidatus Latescibacterota bacterium]